jgi:hypothetical protein
LPVLFRRAYGNRTKAKPENIPTMIPPIKKPLKTLAVAAGPSLAGRVRHGADRSRRYAREDLGTYQPDNVQGDRDFDFERAGVAESFAPQDDQDGPDQNEEFTQDVEDGDPPQQ